MDWDLKAITPRWGNEHIAQGNTLGVCRKRKRLVKAKAQQQKRAFALAGREGGV